MKKIVIAGGTGLIGSKLSILLSKNNYEVVVFTRDDKESNENIRFTKWNPKDISSFQNELIDADYCINLAGASISKIPWTKNYKKLILNSRIETTNSLINALLYNQNCHLINASAIGFYGDSGDKSVDELAEFGAGFMSEVCQKWESKALEFNGKVTILRIGVVFDKSGGAFNKLIMPFKMFVGGPIGSGKQWISWIHIDDLINIILFIINNNLDGIYNLVSPNPITMNEFSKLVSRELKRPNLFRVPEFFIKLLLGESSQIILNSNNVSSLKIQNSGFKFKFPDLTSAVRDLLK